MRYLFVAFRPLLLSAILASGCTALVRPNFTPELEKLQPGQYQIDPMHSYLVFRIEHLGLSKIVGRFNSLDASLDFDPKKIESMQLSAIIDSDSIDVNNNDLETTLQETDWLSSALFPQILFKSTSVKNTESGDLKIAGILTMRGISLPINLNAKFNGGADNLITRKYTIGFSATSELKRSDFGMDTFAAFAGDIVEVEVHGEFLRQ